MLTRGRSLPEAAVLRKFPGARRRSAAPIDALGRRLKDFLGGKAVRFDLANVALEICGGFQRRVLLAEYGIPRGAVSTYSRLAREVGAAGAARAAGHALATNPFPIIIPCHRAVRSDGSLGGYQGGSDMKRALLELEGVGFTSSGKVLMRRVHY
jgi:methylated-DNA-[protein]-cysteine S-methyltransferase